MVESHPFLIKIRTLDSSQFELTVTQSMLVSDLKSAILTRTQVPFSRQRLIYQGKLLKNQQPLSTYGVQQGHVLQLVANTQPQIALQENERPISDIFRLAMDNSQTDLLPRRRRRLNRRREIDTSERLETIRQTLQTLQGMIHTLTTSTTDPENIQAFDITRRQFFRGQWVDVKDTVDQWLEAQVIDFQHTTNGTLIYVHYNGWPNRWDEWLDSSSPRIQPFRTHTYQSLTSPMQSPHPVIAPDAEGVRPPSCPDMNEFMLQTMTIIDYVKSMMDKFYSLSTIIRHQEVGQRVQPLRARLNMFQEPIQEEKKEEDSDSNATAGSDIAEEELELTSEISYFSDQMTIQQQLALLTVQLAPILDRTGRMLTDIAQIMAGNQRVPDDNVSVSSSLVTNQSGNSSSSVPRLTMQVPVMPSPLELSTSNPRSLGPDIDIHVHAIVSQRPEVSELDRNSCWRQIT